MMRRLAASALAALLAGCGGYDVTAPSSIGDSTEPGWTADNCTTEEVGQSSDAAGNVAAVRYTWCDWGFGVDSMAYYVFAKPRGQGNSLTNLVLRYSAINEDTPPPVVTWVRPAHLVIRYAGAVAERVTQSAPTQAITVDFDSSQQYGGILISKRGVTINPRVGEIDYMSFDLLPLPAYPPSDPFSLTGDFSAFHCGSEARGAITPVFATLERMRTGIEAERLKTGQYPAKMNPIDVRVGRILRSRIRYHRTRSSYALDIGFPDFASAPAQPPVDNQYPAPGEDFVNCAALHIGRKSDLLERGGFIYARASSSAPILYMPQFGLYTYED